MHQSVFLIPREKIQYYLRDDVVYRSVRAGGKQGGCFFSFLTEGTFSHSMKNGKGGESVIFYGIRGYDFLIKTGERRARLSLRKDSWVLFPLFIKKERKRIYMHLKVGKKK